MVTEQQDRIEGVGHVVDVSQSYAGVSDAKLHCMERQFIRAEWDGTLAVLDAREPFFFGSRDDDAIAHQTGGGIVKGSIDTQRVHECSLPR